MLDWTPERYAGVGPKSGRECVVPRCGRPVNSRGLCHSCFKAWRRYGLKGLESRAVRLARGSRGVRVPRTVDEARDMLREAATTYVEAEGDGFDDDEAAHREADDHLWRVALVCSFVFGDLKKEYERRYREKFVRTYGAQAWRDRHRLRQRRHVASRKLFDRRGDPC